MLPGLVNSALASPCVVTHLQRQENTSSQIAKKSPFNHIIANPWIHTVDLILPAELWQLADQRLKEVEVPFKYSKVSMTLLQVISADFFNKHIKTGNILMISNGRYQVDNRYYLKDGTLHLELDKPTYEQCGLVGNPIRGLGRVHMKSRYKIEVDLRQPSMVHGKKGFNRLVWAFTRVLTEPLDWLFVDLQRSEGSPIEEFSPTHVSLQAQVLSSEGVVFPWVDDVKSLREQLYQEQLLEWIGLVLIKSSRVRAKEDVDAYLCRYTLPEAFEPKAQNYETTVTHLRWQGLIPARFIRELLAVVEPLLDEHGKRWCAIGSKSIEGRTCLSVRKGRDVISWDIV